MPQLASLPIFMGMNPSNKPVPLKVDASGSLLTAVGTTQEEAPATETTGTTGTTGTTEATTPPADTTTPPADTTTAPPADTTTPPAS